MFCGENLKLSNVNVGVTYNENVVLKVSSVPGILF
jgi:hypothetical protein